MRLILAVAVGAIAAATLVLAAVRARRESAREREIPELNQHPERLEQMLDPTDDA